jgi:hypothetical protein
MFVEWRENVPAFTRRSVEEDWSGVEMKGDQGENDTIECNGGVVVNRCD